MDTTSQLLSNLASPALPGIKLDLTRMESLLNALGNPHHRLPPTIHIAGTNGKGSLVAYLRAITKAAGWRTHSYTSPHLVRFHERIHLNHEEVIDSELQSAIGTIKKHLPSHPATFFEATTAVAFWLFSRHPADLLILETGLGGRLDATNLIPSPILTIITPVDLDHQAFLGNSIGAIAAEKAGILKPGAPCLIGPQKPEAIQSIHQRANTLGIREYSYGNEWSLSQNHTQVQLNGGFSIPLPEPSLPGIHQYQNAATALRACHLLRTLHPKGNDLTDQAIHHGITHAQHPARLQRLTYGPVLDQLPAGSECWLDGGHNPHAARAIAETLNTWGDTPPWHLCLAMMEDKDTAGFLQPFLPLNPIIHCIPVPNEPRAAPPEAIAKQAASLGLRTHILPSAEAAAAQCQSPTRLLITGSLYLAGHILQTHQ